jgi:maltooligosyltrehalose trehalohydrolase
MKYSHVMPFGATLLDGGDVRFRLWAPGAKSVELVIEGREPAAMSPQRGWFEKTARAPVGVRYRYRIDGRTDVPDPASRYNPLDVHGPSELTDPRAFDWQDAGWQGRPWDEAVIYELHVGTFSPEGSFRGVEARLDHFVELGVTAVELMPLSDFPGARGWGYDGVLPFAPDASYGSPDDLKRLVQAAHRRGLMMFLDVVYNHFGPDGNYLHAYAPQFFTDRHQTPWGSAIDFGARPVRDFFIENALYWLEEFRFDGLRFDAVHAIHDDSGLHILEEIADAVHAGPGRHRHIHLVLENDDNRARLLRRDAASRPRHYTAQWNDDFHHAAHAAFTGEKDGYYADYADAPVRRLARCLAEGFAYQGEPSAFRDGERRGEPSADLPPGAFVNFVQNHDQIGNRAFGERLAHLVRDERRLEAAAAVLLLAPSPPLIFMGDEFAAASPFLFFCDFSGDLAKAVREGRRREFSGFARFQDPGVAESIPDPGAEQTFAKSRLDWSSVSQPPHSIALRRYRDLLDVRRRRIVPLLPHLGKATFRLPGEGLMEVRWPLDDGRSLAVVANLSDETAKHPVEGEVIHASGAEGAPWSVRWLLAE